MFVHYYPEGSFDVFKTLQQSIMLYSGQESFCEVDYTSVQLLITRVGPTEASSIYMYSYSNSTMHVASQSCR